MRLRKKEKGKERGEGKGGKERKTQIPNIMFQKYKKERAPHTG